MVLSMKGLWSSSSLTETAPVVGVSVVHPTWARTRESDENDLHRGWQFVDPSVTDYVTSVNGCGRFSTAGCTPDAVHGVQFVRDLYNLADPSDSQGKYTVPILWDTKRNTIVNNESSEILRMLNDQFNAFATTPTLDLYPAPLRTEIDQINQWTYEINNGVYKCGFATSQQAYDQAEAHLYAMLGPCPSSVSEGAVSKKQTETRKRRKPNTCCGRAQQWDVCGPSLGETRHQRGVGITPSCRLSLLQVSLGRRRHSQTRRRSCWAHAGICAATHSPSAMCGCSPRSFASMPSTWCTSSARERPSASSPTSSTSPRTSTSSPAWRRRWICNTSCVCVFRSLTSPSQRYSVTWAAGRLMTMVVGVCRHGVCRRPTTSPRTRRSTGTPSFRGRLTSITARPMIATASEAQGSDYRGASKSEPVPASKRSAPSTAASELGEGL